MNSVSQINYKLSPVGAPRLGILLLHITIFCVRACNLSLPTALLQSHICENALAAYRYTLPLRSTSSLFRASVRLILFRLIFLANARHSLCL